MTLDDDNSLGGDATSAGRRATGPRQDDVSIGDERTLGGGDAAGIDTVIDDIEIVDLEARYRVEGELGRGGMGEVLLALDTRLDRRVAVKRIISEATRSKFAVQRLLAEARAVAALDHPNIIEIYDYGCAKDGPFLIMEYMDGGSLAARCKEGALPVDEAVGLACQLCDGLAKAHDAGLVHRDIKPANVLLKRDGRPKLSDFGLAKAMAAEHGMTATGVVVGTPDYMSPEQRRNADEVDQRSDLWSLAATVYQMVTARRPRVIRLDDVPDALQDVLAKALQDRKESRYRSAREFRDALRASQRVAPPAEVGSVEGRCPGCGLRNDTGRRFCRGCGAVLEAPCLSCLKPMPMWDEICGSCGSRQSALSHERGQAMAARQAEAEALLDHFEFERATAVAEQLRRDVHPRLEDPSDWATSFLAAVERSQKEQSQCMDQAMAEAEMHEATHDYQSAIFALEAVPEPLRRKLLRGGRDSVASALDRVRGKQAEVRRLESLLRDRIAARQFDGLLPHVERLLTLQPGRVNVKRLRQQLVTRKKRLAGKIAARLKQSRRLVRACRFQQATEVLEVIPEAKRSPGVVRILERARRLGRLRHAAITSLSHADGGTHGDAIRASREYRDALAEARVKDTVFASIAGQFDARHEKEVQAAESAAGVRDGFLLAAVLVGLLGLAVYLVVILTEQRSAGRLGLDSGSRVVDDEGRHESGKPGLQPSAPAMEEAHRASPSREENGTGPLMYMRRKYLGMAAWLRMRVRSIDLDAWTRTLADMLRIPARDIATPPNSRPVAVLAPGGALAEPEKSQYAGASKPSGAIRLPGDRVLDLGQFRQSVGEVAADSLSLPIPYPGGHKPFAVLHVDPRSGTLHGPCSAYHENGSPMMTGRYVDGYRDGAFRWTSATGEILLDAHFRNGREHGTVCYYRNGEPALVQECRSGKPQLSHRIEAYEVCESYEHAVAGARSTSAEMEQLIESYEAFARQLRRNEQEIKGMVRGIVDDVRRQRAAARGPLTTQMMLQRMGDRAAGDAAIINALRGRSGF